MPVSNTNFPATSATISMIPLTKISRRHALKSLATSGLLVPAAPLLLPVHTAQPPAGPGAELGYSFRDVARTAGITARNYYGGETSKKYIIEANGCGVAFFDYDQDGWLDIFLLNGWRLEGFPEGQEPTNHLFHNNRDGKLDLFVSNYLVFDPKTAPDPGSNPYCIYRGLAVNCGPRGLQSETNLLYHNNGDGTFADISERSGISTVSGNYGLGVLVGDFDNDGWPDVYVANDDTPCVLFHNQHNGTFKDTGVLAGVAFDANGRVTAGMGVAAADYDCDGWLDIFRTNFSDEIPTLYQNNGDGSFTDVTYPAGVADYTLFVGWGCGFLDPDNDGWADIFYCNGHVYPELARAHTGVPYLAPRVLYRNLGNGRFQDVSKRAGGCITTPSSGRGCAFGDFDNDGDPDIVINNMNDFPSLLRCDRTNENHWITIQAIGTKSNRSAIGARLKCVTGNHAQIDEVRSGGSYLSQNDLRIHFGLGTAKMIDLLEVRWPSGITDTFRKLPADRFIEVREGSSRRK